MSRFAMLFAWATLAGLICSNLKAEELSSSSSAEELFNARIMPIFRSPNPSSCVQCHLSSVDLKEYILPSHEQTFLSLRDQGLIDPKQPNESKILKLIKMGEKDLDEGAKLIHSKMRQQELKAFSTWIEACCQDQSLLAQPALAKAEIARPEKPDAVIRHSRRSSVVDSFAKQVWTIRMRCFPCHTPHELDPANPKHQGPIKKQKEFAEKHPEWVERMRIFRETPEETIDYLVRKSRESKPGDFPMLNLENPKESLLVLKPMSKLPQKIGEMKFAPPSSAEPVSHMGGLKMHYNDQGYKAVVAWIEDYARVVNGDYQSVDELPTDNWRGTTQVLRLTGVSEDWPVGQPVQLALHQWDEKSDDWNGSPIAFTQGTVTPRHMVNGSLLMIEPRHSDAETELGSGRYLVKVYRDQSGKLENNPTLLLGESDFVGQYELDKPRWRPGFRFAETIPAAELTAE